MQDKRSDDTDCRADHGMTVRVVKGNEAAYCELLDALPVAVYTTDAAGTLTHFNEAAVALWGRRPAKGDEGWCGSWQLFNVDGAPLAHRDCPMAVAMREDRPLRGAEAMAVRPDGTKVIFEAYPTPIHDECGALAGALNVLVDVTSRKAAEHALLIINAELERRVEERTLEREAALGRLFEAQKMEAIGRLTGGVAHDFNNLLAAATMNLDLLRNRVGQAPQLSRLVDGILKSVERGTALTKRMLAFARRQELVLEPVDVVALVRDMLGLMESSLGPMIRVETDFALDLPPVLADPHQLELALLNLVVNAGDAMPEGGRLRISAHPHRQAPANAPPSEFIRITVEDTGQGMDKTTMRRATEPFFTTKDVDKGTGLGLSMVHGLAIQLGGAFTLRSEPGMGTTAELRLPRANRPPAQGAQLLSDGTVPGAGAGAILFVDDDALVAAGAAMVLEDLGYAVVSAASGAQALAALESGTKVDLVITDHAMPSMTGLELAHTIRRRWPDLPIVLATGYADLADDTLKLPRLDKPYHREDLARLCTEILDTRSTGRR